jgi:protein O-GlcNAc transferase
MATREALLDAERHRKAGRLRRALRLCLGILRRHPGHFGALRVADALARQLESDSRLSAPHQMQASLPPSFASSLQALGALLSDSRNLDGAAACFLRALRIRPNSPAAHDGLGNIYAMNDAWRDAASCFRRAISLDSSYALPHRGLGVALMRQGRVAQAIAALRSAVSLDPKYAEALSLLHHAKRQACDWSELEKLSRRLTCMVRTRSGCVNPFTFLCVDSNPKEQVLCSRHWGEAKAPAPRSQTRKLNRCSYDKERITVAYLSADFHEHATMRLLSQLFARHDRARFCIHGYSFGPDDHSSTRKKVIRSFDRFIDICDASHAEAADLIRKDGVGFLVDLKGYTTYARPQILALRPAAVQVSYLGYPGTTGMRAIDYAIVDRYLVPPNRRSGFSEQLVYLPHSYQANVTARKASPPRPSRRDCGLPESGFVFCCLNASYKLTPKVFDVWMRLLLAVAGSTLWLLHSNALATANLKREANARGIPSRRLVFAPESPNPEHLAHLPLADLYLDTFPYNSHTLASDALWAGCSLVTCSGQTFASRVAGSLLHAVELPELVCTSHEEYERLALELARNPKRLRAIRRKLQNARRTAPLFDSQRFTKHLETAFETMWNIFQKGERPHSFHVPPAGFAKLTVPQSHQAMFPSAFGVKRLL